MTSPSRPLLIVDGDSFAHRSYHALPKSIRRAGNKGGGAIVGFANFLLRLYESERPRAVLVGWDTLGSPTYRQKLFPAYQGGRQFDDELVEQLDALPELVAACGFAYAKAPGYEADDFLAAAVAEEQRRGGSALVASGDRDAFQLASDTTTVLHPVRAGEMARIGPPEVRERYGVEPAQVPDFIALRGDPSDKLPGARHWRKNRRRPAAPTRDARARACRRSLCRSGGRFAALPPDRGDGCGGAAPVGRRSDPDMGQGCSLGANLGAEPAGGPLRRPRGVTIVGLLFARVQRLARRGRNHSLALRVSRTWHCRGRAIDVRSRPRRLHRCRASLSPYFCSLRWR
jgi:hypothetical protein